MRTGRKMVILVVLGSLPDGRREILDWQIARNEDHQEWEALVLRLRERGCRPEQGLQLIHHCETELLEMDAIEYYREDEGHAPTITIYWISSSCMVS